MRRTPPCWTACPLSAARPAPPTSPPGRMASCRPRLRRPLRATVPSGHPPRQSSPSPVERAAPLQLEVGLCHSSATSALAHARIHALHPARSILLPPRAADLEEIRRRQRAPPPRTTTRARARRTQARRRRRRTMTPAPAEPLSRGQRMAHTARTPPRRTRRWTRPCRWTTMRCPRHRQVASRPPSTLPSPCSRHAHRSHPVTRRRQAMNR
mmetsp:Transcript_1136/g.3519  ORF Transcript_1136/g.3519 Transcript_1136/m.3519 type:complete len:211 (-) Transcript_1136:545-1177(-)